MHFSSLVHLQLLSDTEIWCRKLIVEGYFAFSFVFLVSYHWKIRIFILFQGIPCFAYMMSAMSDFINNQLLHLRQFVEHSHRIKLPRWFIPSIYIGGGSALLVGAPVVIFIKMEKWSILESLYFGEL